MSRASLLGVALVSFCSVVAACSAEVIDSKLVACSRDAERCSNSTASGDDGGLGAAQANVDDAESSAASDAPAFATAYVEDHATLRLPSDGDLWPSCWSDDDALYTANGDGKAFADTFVDIAMSRVTGSPRQANLAGKTIATGSALGQTWTQGNYNRKPTGMLCVDGAIYVAIQDLSTDFLDAPAATIAVSKDHGVTWSWDKSKPMFSNWTMTTLMFLDFGRNNANAFDDNVYAYALDNNWRFTSRRLSPTRLWLARVPRDKVMDRGAWTYFAGVGVDGTPAFDGDIQHRVPVLEDPTKVYTRAFYSGGAHDMTVISQGGIVYDAPLKRYIYTSWTEFTFEFYEAPAPWGPWKKFLSRDYGNYPWSASLNGGYATTIPSKFISADGKEMFVQSNTFVGGVKNYELSFRKLLIEPYVASPENNEKADTNLALPEHGGVPIFRAGHAGPTTSLNDGATSGSVDSWTDEEKTEDYWGIVWSRPRTMSSVAYTTGKMFSNGGWFASLRLEVRQNGTWVTKIARTTPQYPYTGAAGTNQTYVFDFDPVVADGVRVIGAPGGTTTFTSASELAVYYK